MGRASKVLATLSKSDEVVVTGEEKSGFIQVQGLSASSWVKISLVQTLSAPLLALRREVTATVVSQW